jgi:predicted O-linked N-acetylglucosamine transferase (SPINDLY family)
VNDLPAQTNDHITFGCFNNLSKVGPEVKELWAQILKAVPTSKLFLKYKQLVDPAVRDAIQKDFAALGISPDRLILEGSSHLNDYYRSYNRVDIALDPFPYPGGTTTIDALWMGVPTVMLAGDRFVSRNGETIARATGMSFWVAKTKEDYIALAVQWSKKPKELSALRKGLRVKVEASPLMDGKRFAADFEEAIYTMWNERMATLNGASNSETTVKNEKPKTPPAPRPSKASAPKGKAKR